MMVYMIGFGHGSNVEGSVTGIPTSYYAAWREVDADIPLEERPRGVFVAAIGTG
jgi:hypothetical protein